VAEADAILWKSTGSHFITNLHHKSANSKPQLQPYNLLSPLNFLNSWITEHRKHILVAGYKA